MQNRGSLYVKMIGGQNLNIFDLLNDNQNKPLERIVVDCDTTNGSPINIQLPEIQALGGATNFEVLVSDRAGSAGAANIVITRGGTTDLINAGTSITLNTNHAKAYFLVGSINTSGTGANWACLNTQSGGAPYVPPSQVNEVGVIGAGNTYVLANTPLNTQHLIVSVGRQFLTIGVDYTVDYGLKTITFIFGAPGDPCTIFYSF